MGFEFDKILRGTAYGGMALVSEGVASAAASAFSNVSEKTTGRAASWASRIVMVGATSIVVGILWDISWHRTIGRDTFWTPAHMAIYLGGVLGGLTAGWLAVRTTFFGTPEEKAGSVRLWGFRAPFGAWVSLWGCFAMLTSAPFDDWWHNAYGLDVKILSPPHTVLALGMWAVVLGALLLVLREQNRAGEGVPPPGRWMFVYAAGILLAMASVFLTEESFPNSQHSRTFYTMSAATYPLYLVGMARAARFRWGGTLIAGVYMLIIAGMAWVLPLFPGQPRLGPIYNPVTHFVPLPFPLLLIIPAIGIDLVRRGIGAGKRWWRDWLLVGAAAAVFLGLFLLTQWYFSKFMLSSGSHNWFFAGDRHWGYGERPGSWRNEFWNESNPEWHRSLTWSGLGIAFLWALGSTRIGLWAGNWMVRVRR